MVAIHFDGSKEAWHKLRANYIGGSEVAALFTVFTVPGGPDVIAHIGEVPDGGLPVESLSPYSTGYRLWLEKRGDIKPENLDEVERIQAGTFMEPAIAEWAKTKWGWNIRKVRRYLKHATVGGWGASLDYEVHEAGASGAPVEIKNVDYLIFKDQWVVEDDEIVGVPMHINLQVQAQIGVAETDHAWVVACVGGNRLYRGRIERHEPTQALIADAITAFWDLPFAPNHLATVEVTKELFRRGLKDKTADLSGDNEAPMIARSLMRWSRHAKRVEAVLDGLKGRLQEKMGANTRATGRGFTVTWPAISREEKEIPARIQKALDYRGAFTVKEAK